MRPTRWLASNRRLPVFADHDLVVTSAVHAPKCVAVAQPDGIASMQWCRCQGSRRHVEPGTPLGFITGHHDAVLVHEQDSGPFWLEGATLREVRAPPPLEPVIDRRRRHSPPPDYLLIEATLGLGPLEFGRRRRRIRGGEIVFIRTELGPDMSPWRMLCQTFVDNQSAALLIDASLKYESALHPGWEQQRTIVLSRGGKDARPNQFLIPAFPLPDGTLDPGWIPAP